MCCTPISFLGGEFKTSGPGELLSGMSEVQLMQFDSSLKSDPSRSLAESLLQELGCEMVLLFLPFYLIGSLFYCLLPRNLRRSALNRQK